MSSSESRNQYKRRDPRGPAQAVFKNVSCHTSAADMWPLLWLVGGEEATRARTIAVAEIGFVPIRVGELRVLAGLLRELVGVEAIEGLTGRYG